jgi:hypothetical protein
LTRDVDQEELIVEIDGSQILDDNESLENKTVLPSFKEVLKIWISFVDN